MIDINGEDVKITIDEEPLLKAIAYVEGFLEYLQEDPDVKGESAVEIIDIFRTIIETLQEFWCEHFSEKENDAEVVVARTEVHQYGDNCMSITNAGTINIG